MKSFKEYYKIKLNESPFFKRVKGQDRPTTDTANSMESISSRDLYKFLIETSLRTNNKNTARDATEAAAYVAWRINNREAEAYGDLYDPHNQQLGGPRCEAGKQFLGTKE